MKADLQALSEMGISKSLVDEMERDGVAEIFIRQGIPSKPGTVTMGTYSKYFRCIDINARTPIDFARWEIKERIGIDLSPEEIFIWVALHEFGHHKGLNESEADQFAADRLAQLRGYVRKQTIKIDIDVEALIRAGFKMALSSGHHSI